MAGPTTLEIIRTGDTGAAAALVATWLWAELLHFSGLEVIPVDDSTVRCTAPATPLAELRHSIESAVQDARFHGWHMAAG